MKKIFDVLYDDKFQRAYFFVLLLQNDASKLEPRALCTHESRMCERCIEQAFAVFVVFRPATKARCN